MQPPPAAWNDALTSARRAIAGGQARFREAAHSLSHSLLDLQRGDESAPQRIVNDVVELSKARQTIKAGVAVIRADREIGDEIINMVRHDRDARNARDTRPDPRYGAGRRKLDIFV